MNLKVVFLSGILLLLPCFLFAETVKPFMESFYLITIKCTAPLVEMNSGNLKVLNGDDYSLVCDPVKRSTSLKCTYYYKNNTKREIVYNGGTMGSEAAMGTPGMDEFIINMVTRKFISNSNTYIDNGRIRGVKICSGDYITSKDAETMVKKQKK